MVTIKQKHDQNQRQIKLFSVSRVFKVVQERHLNMT